MNKERASLLNDDHDILDGALVPLCTVIGALKRVGLMPRVMCRGDGGNTAAKRPLVSPLAEPLSNNLLT